MFSVQEFYNLCKVFTLKDEFMADKLLMEIVVSDVQSEKRVEVHWILSSDKHLIHTCIPSSFSIFHLAYLCFFKQRKSKLSITRLDHKI